MTNGFVAFFDTPNAAPGLEVPVLAYVDPGQLRVDVFPHGATINPNSQNWILVKGYLLDCTAAPCAAIAP